MIQNKTYTAEEIHMGFAYASMHWAIPIRNLNDSDEKKIEELIYCRQLGFTNSKNYNDLKHLIPIIEKRELNSWVNEKFPGSIILEIEDFIDLCEKYGLTSGLLHNYTGDIPFENLEEINRTKATLAAELDNKFSNQGFSLINEIECHTDIYEFASKADYMSHSQPINQRMGRRGTSFDRMTSQFYGGIYVPPISSSFRSASPRVETFNMEIPNPKGEMFIENNKSRINAFPFREYWLDKSEGVAISSYTDKYNSEQLYIAAPMADFNEQTIEYTIQEARQIPVPIDPFVYQPTKYGVVIYSKWGIESDDEIFKQTYNV